MGAPAAADAVPALAVRGRLPRAGKRAPLMLSLRSLPRRVRDAVRRHMRCGRWAWGFQTCTDCRAQTRRAESLRPFSRARALCGRNACLAPYGLGRPRPALRDRQPFTSTIDSGEGEVLDDMAKDCPDRATPGAGARRGTARFGQRAASVRKMHRRRSDRGGADSPPARGAPVGPTDWAPVLRMTRAGAAIVRPSPEVYFSARPAEAL